MASCVDKLRDEVLDSEKARYDLLKWKLLLVSGLGGAGLGLGSAVKIPEIPHLDYIICLIPLVCIYVDILCAHMSLRIMVIGCYLREIPAELQDAAGYEAFAKCARDMQPQRKDLYVGTRTISAFALEDWALRWSTILLSLLVIVYANQKFWEYESWGRLLICAIPGIMLAIGINYLRRRISLWLTIVLVAIVFAFPYLTLTETFLSYQSGLYDEQKWTVFLTSGLLGFLLTGVMFAAYSVRSRLIERLPIECKELLQKRDVPAEER